MEQNKTKNRLYLRNHSSDWPITWLFEEISSNYVRIHPWLDKFGAARDFIGGCHDFLWFFNGNTWKYRRFSKISWNSRKIWKIWKILIFSDFSLFEIFSHPSKVKNISNPGSDLLTNWLFEEISMRYVSEQPLCFKTRGTSGHPWLFPPPPCAVPNTTTISAKYPERLRQFRFFENFMKFSKMFDNPMYLHWKIVKKSWNPLKKSWVAPNLSS